MIPLTTRQLALLAELLAADGPLTTSELATRCKMTPRKVRYDLRAVEVWLEQEDTRLIKKPNYGLRVAAASGVRAGLRARLGADAGKHSYLSQSERVHRLTLTLLAGEQPLSAKRYARDLGVSHPTVLADMKRVEQFLAERGLQLVRRPHVGFRVAGGELAWREALVQGLMESLGEQQLAALGTGGQPALQQRAARAGALPNCPFLAPGELDAARHVVDALEDQLGRAFADPSRISLVLSLALLAQRVRCGRLVEVEPERLADLRRRAQFEVAQKIAPAIERRFGIALPEQETAYIAMQLLGAWTRGTLADTVADAETVPATPEAQRLARQLLADVACYLQPCLEVDPLLMRQLALHLDTALNRLRFGLPIHCALLEDVRGRYPYIFQVAESARGILEDAAGAEVPDHEIAHIALHLAAAMERLRTLPESRKRVLIVCGEATDTQWLLVSRLQAELPQLEIAEITSAARLSVESVHTLGVSAIISTVPIRGSPVPVLVVSPLLQDEEVAKARAAFSLDSLALVPRPSRDEGREYVLADLLGMETIVLRAAAKRWRDVVERAGRLLVACGAVEPRYVEAMAGMIERHGPYVVVLPGVALLHAHPGDGAKRTCMSLTTLRRPVTFGHAQNDPVRVAIGLATLDNHTHYRALRQLIELLRAPEMLARIASATSRREVCGLIAAASRQNEPILATSPNGPLPS